MKAAHGAQREGSLARDVSEKREVSLRRETDAFELWLGEREVGAVPEADVGGGVREQPLNRSVEMPARFVIGRLGRLVYQAIDFRVAESSAIETRGRDLLRMEDPAKDVGFFAEEPSTWLTLQPMHFAVFFPADAHAPLGGSGPVKKAILKVLV